MGYRMKNKSLVFIIIGVLLLVSCRNSNSQQKDPSPLTQSSQSTSAARSNLSINFSMKLVPVDVIKIVGIISRKGYDTLKKEFLVRLDTASCNFNDLRVGEWHLRVNAYDAANVLRYFGEQDVDIVPGITTPVTLSLESTTGSANVTVTWGNSAPHLKHALLFGGMNGAIVFPPSDDFRLQEFTVEMLVQVKNLGSLMIPFLSEADLDQMNNADGFGLKWEEGNLCFRVARRANLADGVSTEYTFKRGEWVHIACTCGYRKLRIFLNGNILVERYYPHAIYYGYNGFSLGNGRHSLYGGQCYFHGMMDEIRVWSYARTQYQIRQTMRQTLQGNENGLVAYWDCEEDPNSDILHDKTAFGHDGTIIGDVSIVPANAFVH